MLLEFYPLVRLVLGVLMLGVVLDIFWPRTSKRSEATDRARCEFAVRLTEKR